MSSSLPVLEVQEQEYFFLGLIQVYGRMIREVAIVEIGKMLNAYT